MKLINCSSAVHVLLLTAGLGAPAAAQGTLTVISPHPGEQVGAGAWRGGYPVRWSAPSISGNAGFYVYFTTPWGEQREVCVAGPDQRMCQWSEPDWIATSLFVEARSSRGAVLATAQSGSFTVVTEHLPDGWHTVDVGAVRRTGGAWGLGDGRLAVRGAGADIWGTADAFHFAFGESLGDTTLTFTLSNLEGSHRWTKVGVMVRENLTPGSPHHFVLASKSMGLAYQRRLIQNGESHHTALSSSSALPVTFQLARRNNHVAIDFRQGSGPWERAAQFDVSMQQLIGLAVTSHDVNVLATGSFTDVDAPIYREATVQILAPEAGAPIPAGVPVTIAWTHEQPVNVATVSYTVDGGQTWTVIPGCQSIAATTCQWTNPGPVTEAARIRVAIEDPGDRTAWTVSWPFAIREQGGGHLPEPWRSFDIGNVGTAGSAAYDEASKRFTVDGSGADIWSTADAFHFVARHWPRWQQETDFEITARVASVQNVHRWTKAGIMVRTGTGPGAAHASLFATPTTERGVAFQRRRADNGISFHTAGPAIAPPVWLKLIVRTDEVHAYYRHRTTDPWILLGVDTIGFSGTVFDVGLVVSSHQHGTLARATFDHVSVRHLEFPDEIDIGAVGIPGEGSGSEIRRTMRGSGADIWGTADAFRFRYLDLSTQATVSARVLSVEHSHHWAKAGVMIRETFSPGSRHVMLIVSADRGVAMQYRATTNGPSANVAIVPGRAPAWVRLLRDGPLIRGELSEDGETWREVGRIELPMPDVVWGGLALTSHDNTKLTTAEFDDIVLR